MKDICSLFKVRHQSEIFVEIEFRYLKKTFLSSRKKKKKAFNNCKSMT